ncbi:MAG: PDZ domain-containing protein [Flavisolibacter sp.]
MKEIIVKRLFIAGIALLTVPSVFAQKEKDKIKDDKEKVEKNEKMQTIVITRNGNIDQKTTIEIDGDKVKVNGKDAKDNQDVHVNVNTVTGGPGRMRMYNRTPGAGAWNFNMDGNQMSMFSEDENRAMLGVTTEGNDKGAEVESVTKESAAEKAGLKKGDIITKIGDRKIESTDDVTEAVRSHKPGEKVSITYVRDGKTQTTNAELTKWKGMRVNTFTTVPDLAPMGDLNQRFKEMMPMEAYGYAMGRPRLGLSIQDTEDGAGVKVLDVDEESAAAKAGIKEGDIIVGVDDTDIKGTEDVLKATRASRDKTSFKFKVKRGNSTENIEVKIPRKLKTADL